MSKNLGVNASVYNNVPDGWEVVTLGQIVEPSAPIRYGIVQIGSNVEGGVPIVPIKYINNIEASPLPRCSTQIERKYIGSRIQGGDVLLSVKATIGDVGVVPKGFSGNIAREIARIRPLKKYDPYFIAMQLQADATQRRIAKLTVGSTRQEFSIHAVRDFPIAIPKNLSVQHEIVEIISAWERSVEKTETLIDAKERQFRWLQNELMRKGSQGWALKSLKDISSIRKGQQVNRDTLCDAGNYPVWNGGISPSGYTDKFNAKARTITISEGGNSCGFVNFCKVDFWLGGHCYAIENLDSGISPDFLFFFLKSMERNIMQLRVGSGLPNIQRKDIEKLQIYLPTLEKQKSITTIMIKAKKEISLLKELVVQYREQKRGLMQRLVIG